MVIGTNKQEPPSVSRNFIVWKFFDIKLFHDQLIVGTICFNRKKLLESCFLSSNWIDLSGSLNLATNCTIEFKF